METSRIIFRNSKYSFNSDKEHRTMFRKVLTIVGVELEWYLDKYNKLCSFEIRHWTLQTLKLKT